MIAPFPSRERGIALASLALLVVLIAAPRRAQSQSVVLHLGNGDRVAGVLTAETAQTLTLSNTWAPALRIPRAAVAWRETPPAPVAAAMTNTPTAALPEFALAEDGTNRLPLVAAPPRHWQAELNFGANLVYGTAEQQNYFANAALTYQTHLAPDRQFHNALNYSVNYGEANGAVAANQMWGSVKTDFDLTGKLFGYNLGLAGYDDVRKIDLQWEEGPGFGYHVVARPRLTVNTELGSQYLVQNLATGVDNQNVFLRLAQDATWQIAHRIALKENFAYLPQTLDFSNFRLRFESTISFALVNRLSFDVTLLNLFNSVPAAGVERNQLQIRSTLGLHF